MPFDFYVKIIRSVGPSRFLVLYEPARRVGGIVFPPFVAPFKYASAEDDAFTGHTAGVADDLLPLRLQELRLHILVFFLRERVVSVTAEFYQDDRLSEFVLDLLPSVAETYPAVKDPAQDINLGRRLFGYFKEEGLAVSHHDGVIRVYPVYLF